jgi:hypothetical protein
MKHISLTLYLWLCLAASAFAQSAPEAPTKFTEPASTTVVVAFLAVFFGSIAFFGYLIWKRSKGDKQEQ